MKKLTLFFLFILLLSCAKENSQCISSITYVLKSLEIETAGGRQWIENYIYDSEDRLVKIEDFDFEGEIHELEYLDDKLIKVNVKDMTTQAIERVDSFNYDLVGNVVSVYTFSLNPLIEDFAPWYLEYDEQGRIMQMSSDWRIVKFQWLENNITKVEHYDENQDSLYEFNYEFDDKVNYAKGLYQPQIYAAHLFTQPEYWNKNNIVQTDRIDHVEFQYDNDTSELNYPYSIEYDYNEDCYPIRSDGGILKKMTYF